MRFGNKAFQQWHARLKQDLPGDTADAAFTSPLPLFSSNLLAVLLVAILPEDKRMAALELAPYLEDSFGNSVRIDYGTGHEAAFVAFLFCLKKLEA